MAYENIRLNKGNFTVVNGYFWMMNEDLDVIIVKTDDGTQAYSYPLGSVISNPILSLEFDGRNIWSMEQSATDQITIKRWHISNYVCEIRDTFVMVPGGTHKYDADAFTVEHYHIQFSANEGIGETTLSVNDGSNVDSGYTVVLGPNADGNSEEKTVSSAGADFININGSTTYAYLSGDPITFYNNIWLFNNYDGIDDTTGALYKIDGYTGSVVSKSAAGAYKDVKAATFYNVPGTVFGGTGIADSIAYVKGSNMIFLNPSDLNDSYGSMTMDNVESDQATLIDIYDLAIEGSNVYRLQLKATYYGVTASYSEGPYNYQLSTLDSFITSISLEADPAIIPADGGISTSAITAIVKDQFNQPVVGRNVDFTEDDPNGSIGPTPAPTNGNGVANTTYTSGNDAREVRITATAQQT